MKVLLGIGGSDDSFTALDQTIDRATATGDDLTIGIVENPESERTQDEIEERVDAVLSDVDLDVDVRTLTGDPGSELLDVAEREGFDQIVLGGGQRSQMGKIKLGQIAEFVLLNSHVTVKLVRES